MHGHQTLHPQKKVVRTVRKVISTLVSVPNYMSSPITNVLELALTKLHVVILIQRQIGVAPNSVLKDVSKYRLVPAVFPAKYFQAQPGKICAVKNLILGGLHLQRWKICYHIILC